MILHFQKNFRQKIENNLNIGIFNPYTEVKGKEIYDLLVEKYDNQKFNGKNIRFFILGENLPYYDENEYFNLIKNLIFTVYFT